MHDLTHSTPASPPPHTWEVGRASREARVTEAAGFR